MTSTGEPGNASGIPRRVMRAAVAVHQAGAHLVIVTIFLRPKRTRISSPSLFPATVAIAASTSIASRPMMSPQCRMG
jgi:hypothetical protein